MKYIIISVFACLTLLSCTKSASDAMSKEKSMAAKSMPAFDNDAHRLVYDMVQKVGNYGELIKRNDVVYTYTYATPDGKTDVSIEKYIFDGELSYGEYAQHERTFPELKGTIEQGYDGNEYWLKHEGKVLNDAKLMKGVAFKRPTNFYWFAMMPKLLDSGVNYEYIEEKMINTTKYDVVKVSFDSMDGKPKDIYQLFINKTSGLADQFLFTVMDFGIADPLLMKVEYENVDGLLIPSTRKYKKSNWDAEETEAPWIDVLWRDIKFNNNLKKSDFMK